MQIAQFLTAFPKRSLATLVLLGALESQALTLGRIQGAALIGRPLAVSIGVQFDPGQNLTTSCFEADVFHGDTRQDPARVRVRLETASSGQGHVLRVNSDNAVNEPVVTVYLRAGCAQMLSRRYVMLADLVSEQAAPVPQVVAVPLVVPTPSVASTPSTSSAPSIVSGAGTSTLAARAPETGGAGSAAAPQSAPRAAARPAPTARPAARKPAPAPAKVAATAPAAARSTPEEKPRAARATGQSRLRLDPLELLSERVATLESVTANAPVEVAEREARDAQRLDSLEASVKTLVALAAKNEATLLDLRTRLERAQAERYNNPVVYLLRELLLASLLAIAYLLARSGRRAHQAPAGNWWDGSAAGQAAMPSGASAAAAAPAMMAQTPDRGLDSGLSAISEPSPLSPDVAVARPDMAEAAPQTLPMTQGMAMRQAGAASASTPVDVSLVEMSESTFDRLMQSGSAHSAVRKPREDDNPSLSPQPAAPSESRTGSVRQRIDSDEAIDVRQRAEFFVSLGQTDQAVQVLEARIAQDKTTCPQAFLDLLQLFHSLGLKADYQQLRADFSQIFNAQVPEFAAFDDEGRDLEDYPGTVDRLIAVWERPSALDVLEHLLYRQEGDTAHQPFDLAGFRDLLMLYAVAQAARAGDTPAPGAEWAPSGMPQQLDIDLSDLMDAPEPEQAEFSATEPLQTPAVTPPRAVNLIDFDLTEIPIDNNKKPGGKS